MADTEEVSGVLPAVDVSWKRADRLVGDGVRAHIEAAQRSWKSSNVSPTVIAGTLNCLARLFRVAIKQGDLSVGMAAVERARSGIERVTPTLTVEEVDRLAAACDKVSRRYGDYVRLAAFLGLRAGELTALQVGDVDLTLGVVTIRRASQLAVADSEIPSGTPGPRRGRRPVPDDQRSEAF